MPVYLPTPQEVVTRMLVEAKLMAGQKLVDLGSGDGRIVVTAAKQFGARSVGYEIDKELVAISRTKIAEAKITDLASIEASDLFKADLTDVDVLAIYLYPVVMDQLKKQIENMHPGAIWDWRTTFDLYLQTPIENTTQRWKQELAIEQFKCPCSSRIAMHDGITFLISVTVAKQ